MVVQLKMMVHNGYIQNNMKKIILLVILLFNITMFANAFEKPKFNNNDPNIFGKWVTERLVYPEDARKACIKGIVVIQFTIDVCGRVKNIKVLQSVHPLLDKEVIRVVSMSPKWKPAKWDEMPMESHFTLPIGFILTNGKK